MLSSNAAILKHTWNIPLSKNCWTLWQLSEISKQRLILLSHCQRNILYSATYRTYENSGGYNIVKPSKHGVVVAGEVKVRMSDENGPIFRLGSGGRRLAGRRSVDGSRDGGGGGDGVGGRMMRFWEREGVVVFMGVGYEEVCGVHTASFDLFSCGTTFWTTTSVVSPALSDSNSLIKWLINLKLYVMRRKFEWNCLKNVSDVDWDDDPKQEGKVTHLWIMTHLKRVHHHIYLIFMFLFLALSYLNFLRKKKC